MPPTLDTSSVPFTTLKPPAIYAPYLEGNYSPYLDVASTSAAVAAAAIAAYNAAAAAAAAPAAPATAPAAPAEATAPDPSPIGERRVATDGERYTRAEFYEFYGGDAEWEMAGLGDVGGLALEPHGQQTPAQAASAVPSSAWLGGSLEPAGIDDAQYNAIAAQIEAERLRMRAGTVLGATAEEYENSALHGASVPPDGGEGARHGAQGLSDLLGSLGDLLNATAEIANLPPHLPPEIANLPPHLPPPRTHPMRLVPPPEAPSRAPSRAPPHLQPHHAASPGAALPLQPVAGRPPLAEEATSSPAAALFVDYTMPAAPGAATDALGWGAYPYLWGTSTSATYEGY